MTLLTRSTATQGNPRQPKADDGNGDGDDDGTVDGDGDASTSFNKFQLLLLLRHAHKQPTSLGIFLQGEYVKRRAATHGSHPINMILHA